MRTAVVHDAGNAVDTTGEDLRRFTRAKELKDHPESGSSFKKRIIELHARFRKVLPENGVRLLSPAPQPEAFCQVFTRDPCFAIGDRLLVGSLRDKYHQAEIAGLSELRKQFTKVISLSGGGATIEGGDVLVLGEGRRVLVGMNRHTNEEGCRKLAAALAGSGEGTFRRAREGPDFAVLDANGTDGEAAFELPNPDPNGDGTTVYSVFARALGTPGGKSLTTTCATDPFDGSQVCSMITPTLERGKGKSTFDNVSKYLLYIYADINGDGVLDRVGLFDGGLQGYFWDYNNLGLKLAQLRFYDCSTTVPVATDPNGPQTSGCFK